jgi:hypothetical protein
MAHVADNEQLFGVLQVEIREVLQAGYRPGPMGLGRIHLAPTAHTEVRAKMQVMEQDFLKRAERRLKASGRLQRPWTVQVLCLGACTRGTKRCLCLCLMCLARAMRGTHMSVGSLARAGHGPAGLPCCPALGRAAAAPRTIHLGRCDGCSAGVWAAAFCASRGGLWGHMWHSNGRSVPPRTCWCPLRRTGCVLGSAAAAAAAEWRWGGALGHGPAGLLSPAMGRAAAAAAGWRWGGGALGLGGGLGRCDGCSAGVWAAAFCAGGGVTLHAHEALHRSVSLLASSHRVLAGAPRRTRSGAAPAPPPLCCFTSRLLVRRLQCRCVLCLLRGMRASVL